MANIEEEEDFETLKLEDFCDTDDSDVDPDFDLVEETRSGISKVFLKKTRHRKVKEIDSESEEGEEAFGVEIPKLNEKDEKCFEKVEEIIKDGHVQKLKVDQCKVYLRKYGLRLTGKKSILIERIKQHLEIINGGGEKKYPICSFVLNCKGDACTGDVVMFEQKVYEMYNVASRSATGPPCGTRIVAGRIVKESYGAAKQQHTFTIEVLWSKGEKPLLPLHPLLIKGRNLYRLKTMRQKWTDEEERRKVLEEKHSRGFVARFSRDTRIKVKEMWKMGGMHRTESKIGQHPSNPKQTQAVQQQQFQHKEKGIALQQDNSYKCPVNPVPTKIVQLQQKNIQQQQRQLQPFQDLVQLQQKIIQQHKQQLQPFQNQNIPKLREHLYPRKQLPSIVPLQKPRQCDNKVVKQNNHVIRSPQHGHGIRSHQHYHRVQSPQCDHGSRSPQRDHGIRSPQHYQRVQSPQHDHGIQSPQHNHGLRSPQRYDKVRSPRHDQSLRSPQHLRRIQSPQRDLGFRSPQHYRRIQSPQHDRGMRSPPRDRGMRSPQHYHRIRSSKCDRGILSPPRDHCILSPQRYNRIQSPKPDHGFRGPLKFPGNHHQYKNHLNDNSDRSERHRSQPVSSSSRCVWSPERQHHKAQPRQWCWYYRHGRCYYGENCKYLHG